MLSSFFNSGLAKLELTDSQQFQPLSLVEPMTFDSSLGSQTQAPLSSPQEWVFIPPVFNQYWNQLWFAFKIQNICYIILHMEEKHKRFGSQAFFSVWGTKILDNNQATELEKMITDILL